MRLPILAGLRRGVNEGQLTVRTDGQGSEVIFESEREELHLHRSAVAVLLFGGLGGIACVLWPFFPSLLAFAPVGFILAFMSWLMITSRLSMSSPQDFLEDLAQAAAPEAEVSDEAR